MCDSNSCQKAGIAALSGALPTELTGTGAYGRALGEHRMTVMLIKLHPTPLTLPNHAQNVNKEATATGHQVCGAKFVNLVCRLLLLVCIADPSFLEVYEEDNQARP